MKLNLEKPKFSEIRKLQEGGEMPTQEPVQEPAPEQGGDPMEQIIQAAAQAVQTQDAQLALQVCQALVQMAGGGAPTEPQAPEGVQPVYKKGGKLSRWISK